MKKIIIVLIAGLLLVAGCGSKKEEETSNKNSSQIQQEENSEESELDNGLSFNDTFEFDGFELTIQSDIEWDTVKNQFSEQNGAEVMLIPMHIKNISGESKSMSMFSISLYGSSGVELDSVDSYFDNTLGYDGVSLRDGTETDVYLAMLYDGDGDYYIEFSDFFNKIEVRLPISK